ncbi:MAG: hypothetical protein KAG84_08805 [Bacteroidales bacterium]|nr:hypothetical protein [Bacteroidales bacterium]
MLKGVMKEPTKERYTKIISDGQKEPSVMKRSKAKMWIKIIVLIIFTSLFTHSLYIDLQKGYINYQVISFAFIPSIIIGLWLRKLVPLQVHKKFSHITFSFDKIYFVIILLLYITKKVCQIMDIQHIIGDISMVIIIGLMLGRVIGLFIRLKRIRIQHLN